jgi:GxxExxY protein
MTKLLHQDLTYAIIGAAQEVHTVLGPGFLEAVYESALAHEFNLRGISYKRQEHLKVSYKKTTVGNYLADFVVAEAVIVELKATRGLTQIDEAQLINYLKATEYRVGLLLNFGPRSLEHKRRVV